MFQLIWDALAAMAHDGARYIRVGGESMRLPHAMVWIIVDELPMRIAMYSYASAHPGALHHHRAVHRRPALPRAALAGHPAAAGPVGRHDGVPPRAGRGRDGAPADQPQRRDRRGRPRVPQPAARAARLAAAKVAAGRGRRRDQQDQPRSAQHAVDGAPAVRPAGTQRRPAHAVAGADHPQHHRPRGAAGQRRHRICARPADAPDRRDRAGRPGRRGRRGAAGSRARTAIPTSSATGSTSAATTGRCGPTATCSTGCSSISAATPSKPARPRSPCASHANGGYFEVDVADNGPGVPQAVAAQIFRPFTTGGRAGGAGLGLAIARDLVRIHGGDITLAETSATGTTFRFTLPL